jgi:hypothetical protein
VEVKGHLYGRLCTSSKEGGEVNIENMLRICKRDWSPFPVEQYPWRLLDRELSMLTHLLSEER